VMNENASESCGDEARVSPNVNCLSGKRCRECGSYGPFEVVVLTRVLLTDDGCGELEDGAIVYDDDSPAMCHACRNSGRFGDFDE
jgi:hypothetical protein